MPFDISSSGVSRFTYEVAQFAALGIIVLLTVVFYIWGHLEKRNKDVVVQLNFTEEGTTGTVMNESVLNEGMMNESVLNESVAD